MSLQLLDKLSLAACARAGYSYQLNNLVISRLLPSVVSIGGDFKVLLYGVNKI